MSWSREFGAPIELKDGRSIATLGQGRALILNLPVRHQVRQYWQHAAELLLIASENEGALEMAHAQLSRALMIEGLLQCPRRRRHPLRRDHPIASLTGYPIAPACATGADFASANG
jgi:hypothetical protein